MNSVTNAVTPQSIRQGSGYLYLIYVWGTALILSLITYIQPGTHLEFIGGIDHSWAYALNYAFDKKLVMGRDIFFTFGPLGFLEHTRVVSLKLLYISSIFSLLISIAMNASLLHFAWNAENHKGARALNILMALGLVVVVFPEMQRLLVLGYLLLFLHWNTRNDIYLVLFSISVIVCALIKFSYGAASFSLWAAYLVLLSYRNKNFSSLILPVVSMVVAYLAIWLLIYGHLHGAWGYLQGEFYISSGNASAMATNPENNWIAIPVFFSCIVAATVILYRQPLKKYAVFPLVFAMPLLVWIKYTFSQEQQFHFLPILCFMLFMMSIFWIAVSGVLQKIQMTFLMILMCYAWAAMHTEAIGKPDYYDAPHLTLGKPEIMHYDFKLSKLFFIWRNAEKEVLQPLVLPEDMRRTIGDASVDIYPWELDIASVNKLNWHPRPLFQIYISYLPFLDAKNRDYFNGSNAPEYIVWHHHFYQDIMNRYSLSSEPMTTQAILTHYRMLDCKGYFCLWKHTDEAQLKEPVEISSQIAHWNEWIPVPAHQDEGNKRDIIRAKLFAKRTLLGRINLLAWKEGGIEIDYQLKDGAVKTHDLLIDNAVSGVWISPYVESFLGNGAIRPVVISPARLKEIFSQPAASGNIDIVQPKLTTQRIAGWALISGIETQQENYILLFNDSNAFLFSGDQYSRPDVADHFAALQQKVPGMCGVDQEVSERTLPAGDYKVRLLVKAVGSDNKEHWAATVDQGSTVHIDGSANKDQVAAVRFRTSKLWAFSDELLMQWQQLSFIEGLP